MDKKMSGIQRSTNKNTDFPAQTLETLEFNKKDF